VRAAALAWIRLAKAHRISVARAPGKQRHGRTPAGVSGHNNADRFATQISLRPGFFGFD